jgi:hypothetical protein
MKRKAIEQINKLNTNNKSDTQKLSALLALFDADKVTSKVVELLNLLHTTSRNDAETSNLNVSLTEIISGIKTKQEIVVIKTNNDKIKNMARDLVTLEGIADSLSTKLQRAVERGKGSSAHIIVDDSAEFAKNINDQAVALRNTTNSFLEKKYGSGYAISRRLEYLENKAKNTSPSPDVVEKSKNEQKQEDYSTQESSVKAKATKEKVA